MNTKDVMPSSDDATTLSINSPVNEPITNTSPNPCLPKAPIVEDVTNDISTSDPKPVNRPPETPECAKFVGKVIPESPRQRNLVEFIETEINDNNGYDSDGAI